MLKRYYYCPIPWWKIEEISISSNLSPFLWEGESYIAWKGAPALVFFSKAPSLSGINNILYLRVEENFLPPYGVDISKKFDSSIEALLFQHSVDLIPGTFSILVDGTEETKRDAIFSFGAGIQQSKYTKEIAEKIIEQLGKEDKTFLMCPINICPEHFAEQYIQTDRMRAIQLLLFTRKFYLIEEQNSWSSLLGLIKRFRNELGFYRSTFNCAQKGKPNPQIRELLNRIDGLLSVLVEQNTQIVRNWVTNEIKDLSMCNEHMNNCIPVIHAVVDFIMNVGDESIKRYYFIKAIEARNELSETRYAILKQWQSLRRHPENIEYIKSFSKLVQAEAFEEKVRLITKSIKEDIDGPFTDIPKLCTNLSHEEGKLFSIIADTVVNFRPDVSIEQWKKNGFSQSDQIEMIKSVAEAIRTIATEEQLHEINEILAQAYKSFDEFVLSKPQYSRIIMNFLVFIQNPLDYKRLFEQQQAWNCSNPELGQALQAGFLGFKSCPGNYYHTIFTSIFRERVLQEKYYSWLFATSTDKELYATTNIEFESNKAIESQSETTKIEEQILCFLKKYNSGRRLSCISNAIGCDKKTTQSFLYSLKNKKLITCENRLWMIDQNFTQVQDNLFESN